MKRKSSIGLFLFFIFCFGTTAYSQRLENRVTVYQPNFAGTWKLDLSRSKFDAISNEVLRELKNYSRQLIIEQNFPVIKMTNNEKFDGSEKYELIDHDLVTRIYFADGRGENEPIDLKVSTSQVVAKIVGEKLVITLYGLDNYNRKKIVSTTEFSVADNGNTLIEERKLVTAVKPRNEKEAKKIDDLANAYLVFARVK